MAIRPRTLSISLTPILAGSALALADGAVVRWLPLLTALACTLLIQIGTNLHNDAVDFEKGNDLPDRLGPLRVTAAGWAQPNTVRRAAYGCFGAALLLGVYLLLLGGWPIFWIGIASLLAGWAYSGGPWPISHTPFGELFVLLFFGLIAVAGSYWLQGLALAPDTLLAGLVIGLPAAAVLLVNNTRDVVADQHAGRRTLAAVLGKIRAVQLYTLLMLLPFALLGILASLGHLGALLALGVLPRVRRLILFLQRTPMGQELNLLLANTAQTGFLLGLLFSCGLLLEQW